MPRDEGSADEYGCGGGWVGAAARGGCLSVGSLRVIMQTHGKEGGTCGTHCDQANSDLFTKTSSLSQQSGFAVPSPCPEI